MANRYWVGGAGNWATGVTTNWSATSGGASGASVPTAADSVFFDQAGTYTVTLNGALTCLDITVSAGTVTFAQGSSPTLAISGSMSLVAGTVWSTISTITFNAATTGQTITTNGTTLNGAVTFNNVLGEWSLGSSLTVASNLFTTLTAGTLSLNGFNLTTGGFATAGAVARSVAFGTNNIVVNGDSGTIGDVLSMAVLGGFTYTGTGGFTADASILRSYRVGSTSGGSATNSPNLTLTGSGTAVQTFTTGSWFNKLNFGTTGFTVATTTLNLNSLTLSSGGTFTNLSATIRDTGTITPNGKTILALTVNHTGTTTLAGALVCTNYTQTAGTINFATFNVNCSGNVIYTDGVLNNIGTITVLGTWTCAGTFTLTQGTLQTLGFVVTGGFNYNGGTLTTAPTYSGLSFTHTSGTVTLGQAMSLGDSTYTLTSGTLNLNNYDLTLSYFSSSNANTRSIAFGTGNIITISVGGALALDMANATNFSCTGTGGFSASSGTGRTFTFGTTGGTSANALNLTFTGASGAATQTLTTGSWFNKLDFGSSTLTLPATTLNLNGLTLSSGGTFTGLTATLRGTGTITGNGKTIAALTINHTGTTTFASALGCTTYTQTAGDVNFATFNLTCSSTATYTAGTLSNIGTISCTTWAIGTSTFTISSGTISASTSFTLSTGAFNYNGGTITTPSFVQSGAGTVTLGATFTLASTCTYTLTAGTLNLNGFNLSTGLFATAGAVTRTVAFGTNNITLTATSGTVLSMAVLGGFTYTGTGGFTADASVVRTYSVGSTSGGASTNSPNLTFTGSGTAIPVITTGSWFNNLNFGTTAFTLAATTLNLNTLTLSSGGTFTNLSITMVGAGTINTGGKTIAGFAINNGAGTTTLAAAVSCTTYTQTAGTIDFANFNLACSSTATYTAGTLTNTGTITCTTWTCAGTFTMSSGTITPSTSFAVTGGFNYNSGTLSAVPTFTHTSGTVTLGQAYALTATGTYSLTTGTLNLNGFNLTTGIFSSSGTQVRAIAFGTNNIILAHTTAATTVLSMATATGFTYTGTGGFTAAADITRTYTFGTTGGSATNSPNLTWTGTGSAVQTLTTGSWFNILNFGTTTFNPGTTALNLNSLVLSSGGTYTGLTPSMESTGSITSNGKSIAGLTIDNGVGTTTFTDQLTFATATVELTLSSGNLNLSGFNLTVGRFSSNSTSTRSIIFGTNNIILAHTTAATTVLSILTATNLSYTGTGGFVSDASITRTFNVGTTAGGSTTSAPNLTFTGSGTAVQTFTTAGWFNNLNFGTTAFAVPTTSINVSTLTLSSGGTFTALQPILTRTQTWTSQFSKQLAGLGFNLADGTLTLDNTQTYITNSTFELTNGTLDLGGYDLTIGRFIGSNSNTRGILFGSNNIILNWSTAGATNLSMANATNFTYTGTGGFTAAADITRAFVFGTSAGGTSTNSPNLTLTGSGTAVQTFSTTSTFNKLDFGTTSFTVASTSLSVNSLTLSSGGTFTSLTLTTFGTGTITTNGKTIAGLTINCPSETTTLAGALATGVTETTTLTAGTLDLAGFTLTTGNFSSNNTNTRSISFGSGSISLVNTTAGATVLSMANATNFTCTGTGGFTAAANITRTYTFGTTGGSATNAPNLTLTGSGTAIQTFTTGSWFDILNFGTTAFAVPATILNIDTLTLSSGGTFTNLTPVFTRTQTWTSQFSKQLAGIGVNGTGVTLTLDNTQTYTSTSQCILTAGTLDLGGYDFTIGTISSSNTNTRSIAFGSNNIILSTTTAAAVNISMADATNFSCTGTGGFTAAADITRTYTFGTTGGSATNSPNLTLTGSGTAVQTFTTGSTFNKLDFGTTSFTVAATALSVNSLTLSTSGTFTGLTITTFGSGTITAYGKTIAGLTINCPGGATTIAESSMKIYTWTGSGSITFPGINPPPTLEYLVVGGGGGGGVGGGGGAGGLLTGSASITGGTSYSITVGSGGTATYRAGVLYNENGNGADSSITGSGLTSIIALGGGAGATSYTANGGGSVASNGTTYKGAVGGSGGGSGGNNAVGNTVVAGGAGTAGQGNNGGSCPGTAGSPAGGGGGAGAVGGNATGGSGFAGAGGIGLQSSISGTATYYAGGGGGGSSSVTNGAGGLGGGGAGSSGGTTAGSGTANTGGGGGGNSGSGGTSGAGGSGIVIIRYLSSYADPSSTTGSPSVTFLSMAVQGITTLTAGELNVTAANLRTGAFASTNTSTRAVSFGSNNIILNSSTAGTTVVNMATATGFTYTGTGGFVTDAATTRTLRFGDVAGGSIANSPNITLTGSGTSVITTQTGSWFSNLNFGTTAFTLPATSLNLASLTLSSTGTYTGLTATMVDTGTITPNGKTIAAFTINHAGTTTLAGALGCTTYTQTAGTIDFATFNLACSSTATYTAGTLTNTGTITCTTWTCAGTFTMTNGTITPSISFVVTGGFNYNGGTLSAIGTFTHTSGTVTLGQSYALTGTGIYTLTVGTLNLTSYNLTTGQFSSNNANTRSISFGSGNIVLALTTAATTNLSMANATGCTVTGTGGFTAAADITRTFTFGTTGGSIDNAPNLTLTGSGTAIATITTGSWFNKLDFGTTAFTIAATTLNLEALTLSATGIYTNLTANMVGTGTITPNGKTIATLTVNCPSGTTTLAGALTIGATATTTLTAGTLDLSGFILTTGIFSSSNTNTRSINFNSGNIALATSTAASTVLSMANATNFTVSGAGGFTSAMSVTRTFTFGTTGGSASNAPSLALTSGASIPTITTGSWFDVLDFTGTTSTPSTTTLNLDTLTLATGGTYTGLTPFFTRTQTWTAQYSKQLAGIGVNNAGVTLTLDNTQTYITNSTLYVEAGTLSLGSSSVTFNNFISTGTGSRTITGPGTITIINNWTVNSGSAFTGSNYTIYMASQSAKTFAGTGGTYGTLVQGTTASLTITGSNAFEDIQTNNSSLAATGQQEFTTPGTYSWTAPAGVTSVDVVAVGAGGGGYSSGINTTAGQGGAGGGLGWKNNISVTPGSSYTVVVGQGYRCTVVDSTKANDGGPSYFIDLTTVAGLGGQSGDGTSTNAPVGGGYVGDGGGNGGSGAVAANRLTQGAGGAGGYSGNGGNGGVTGVAGSGGGGGGSSQVSCSSGTSGSASGGGVGLYGEGASGAAGTGIVGGGGGSSGVDGGGGVANGTNDAACSTTMGSKSGGSYGGGGGAFSGSGTPANSAAGGGGAVRIIWGPVRSFPTTNTQNVPTTGTFGIVFEAGTTQILNNFTASGTTVYGTSLTSTVPGTQFTLLKTTGTVDSNYLTIQDSNVSAAFFANTTSTDAGNNTGWNFTAPAVVQSGFSTFF